MAAEPIDIIIRRQGDKEAAQGILGIGAAAEQTDKQVSTLNSTLGFLKAAVAGYVGINIIGTLKEQADTYSSMISRLKLVSTSQEELIKTEQALFDVAQRTRGSFQETTNLYSKLALQAGNLGIEQKDLIPTIETINKAIAIQGATAQESTAGLIQFSQGLASNRFQGDELKSVLEGLPVLGTAIAKGMGITSTQLRKLGEEGKLTAKEVLGALQKSAPEIARQFAAVTPTISQAFTVLSNAWLRFIGQTDQASGVSRAIAQVILLLANNINLLIGVLGNAVVAWASFKAAGIAVAVITPILQAVRVEMAAVAAASAIGKGAFTAFGNETVKTSSAMTFLNVALGFVRGGFQALWATIRANPFVFLVTIITTAIGLIYTFGNAIRLNASGSISLLGAIVGGFNYIILKVQELYAWLTQTAAWKFLANIATETIKLIVDGFSKLVDWVAKVMEFFGKSSEGVRGWSSGIVKAMEEATRSFDRTGLASADLGKGFKDTSQDLITGADSVKLKVPDAFTVSKKAIADFGDVADNVAETYRNALGEMINVTDEWARRSGAAFNSVKDGATSAIDTISSAASGSSSSGGGGGGSSGGGGGGGSSGSGGGESSTGSLQALGLTEQVLNERFGIPFGQLRRYLVPAEQSFGTPNFVSAIRPLNDYLAGIPKDASKYVVAQYRYLNSWFEDQALPTFRTGGSFSVGGNGGTDSQLVQFMASPNERVTVETPNQQRSNKPEKAQRPIVVQMQVVTKDADSFRRSEQQQLTGLLTRLGQVAGRTA